MLYVNKSTKQAFEVPMKAGKSKFYFGLIFLAYIFSFSIKMDAQSPDSPPWAWAKSLSATHGIHGRAVAVNPTGSGDIYVAGGFGGRVDFDPGPNIFNVSTVSLEDLGVFIVKLDASGNFVWVRTMVGVLGSRTYAVSMVIDPTGSGAIYTTGHLQGTIDFDPGPGIFNLTSNSAACSTCEDIFISKLDGEGNFEWATIMGGTQDDFGSSLAIDPGGSGDVYLTGQFKETVDFNPDSAGTFNLTSNGNYDIFISKLNRSGIFQWTKAIGGIGNDISRSIAFDHTGGGQIYIAGCFDETVDFDPGVDVFNLNAIVGQDNFISKMDSSGKFIWAKQLGRTGSEYDGFLALDPAGTGDVYTTGSFLGTGDFDPGESTFSLTSDGNSDIFISKLSDSGNFKKAKRMGGTSLDFGKAIAIQPGTSGNIYTVGNFNGTANFNPGEDLNTLNSAGADDIFISSLDSSGNFKWVKAIKGVNEDYVSAIAVDNQFLYVTGYFYSSSISLDSLTTSNTNTTGGAALFIAKLDFTVATADIDSKTQPLKLYPNPATNEFTIELNGHEFYKGDITLFNILGEIVHYSPDENFGGKKTIDISALSTGIYFVELNIDGIRVTEKVVKE